MGEYAQWWTRRHAVRVNAVVAGNEIEIEMTVPVPDLSLRIVRGGREVFVDAGSHNLESLQWRATPLPTSPPHDLVTIRTTTIRMLRHSLEDAVSRFRQ